MPDHLSYDPIAVAARGTQCKPSPVAITAPPPRLAPYASGLILASLPASPSARTSNTLFLPRETEENAAIRPITTKSMTYSLEQFLPKLPPEAAPTLAWVAAAGAAFGVVLWLLGSRFSRSLITLVAVATGAAIGLYVPRWVGLSVGSWAGAVGGALSLGVIGYILHRGCVRIGLGILLGAVGVLGTWYLRDPAAQWTFPPRADGTSLWNYALQLWDAVPQQVRSFGPIACGAGLASGLVIGAFLPRLAMALFYSLIGTCMIAGLGSLAANQLRPELLNTVPQDPTAQLIMLAGLVAFGAAVQWWFSPRAKRPKPVEPVKNEIKPLANKGDGSAPRPNP